MDSVWEERYDLFASLPPDWLPVAATRQHRGRRQIRLVALGNACWPLPAGVTQPGTYLVGFEGRLRSGQLAVGFGHGWTHLIDRRGDGC